MSGKPLHECGPGEAPCPTGPARVVVAALQASECSVECGLYGSSGDEVHLWRAWRTARACGDLPVECLQLLLPHLDALAAAGIDGLRADQRRRRNDLLVEFYRLLPGRRRADVYRRVAARFSTRADVVKQAVLEYECRTSRVRKR